MMLVHVQIAFGFELQVEAAVLGEQLEHVIEETNASRDGVLTTSFDLQRAADPRFFCVPLQLAGSHAWSTSTNLFMSSRTACPPSPCITVTSSFRRSLAL